jgi:hypothetical protein
MKVRYEDSCTYMVEQVINKLESDVILRSDLNGIDNERQVTRAINSLVINNVIVKIGYGVYAKLSYSKLTGRYYLKNGFNQTAKEAFLRLGATCQASESESSYNNGRSTQIPVNPSTKLSKRIRRPLTYKGMTINASK